MDKTLFILNFITFFSDNLIVVKHLCNNVVGLCPNDFPILIIKTNLRILNKVYRFLCPPLLLSVNYVKHICAKIYSVYCIYKTSIFFSDLRQ